MRGMRYLTDRPACDLWPSIVKINRWHKPERREIAARKPRAKRSNDRRSSMDKTGQHTRLKQRELIIRYYGALCHICLANGITDHRAIIDLMLVWPHPSCFTRDHLIPRARGGSDDIGNLRAAHHQCNRDRGDGPVFPVKLTREAERG